MNNYDGPRKNEMDEMLQFLYKMSAKRPLDHSDVYNTLSFYGLKKEDRPIDRNGRVVLDGLNNTEHFRYWIERFYGKDNIDVFVNPGWSYFCQFVNNLPHSTEHFIKLYIPIDAAHLHDGANILFDFLERNNISHLSKISKKLRVDNVIVRLNYNDRETAMKIINFINSNPYLKSGLNKPNPFVPTVNGIGYIQDYGFSYVSDLAHYICLYINSCRKQGLPDVNAEGFRDFLQDCKKSNVVLAAHQKEFDGIMMHNFDIAYTGIAKSLNSSINLTTEQKRKILIDSLKETYRLHGIDQVKEAILQIVKYNNYASMSNG